MMTFLIICSLKLQNFFSNCFWNIILLYCYFFCVRYFFIFFYICLVIPFLVSVLNLSFRANFSFKLA